MHSQLDAAERAFKQRADAFVARHWGQGSGAWRRALAEAGWSVPNWPVTHGGPGWSATRRFLWAQACASRGAPALADAGVSVVGPLLISRYADNPQRRHLLQQIRSLRDWWSIAWAEPKAGADVALLDSSARPLRAGAGEREGEGEGEDGWQVSGSKIWVADGMQATRLLWLARIEERAAGYGLFLLDTEASAVTRRQQTTWDGADTFVRIDAEAVAAQLLMRSDDVEQLVRLITPGAELWAAWGAIAASQFDALTEAARDCGDESLMLKLSELAVDLQSLQGMEARFVDAQARGEPEPFPAAALRLKGQQLLLEIGHMQIDALGYYALPFPDQLLTHNEGPIGPVGAGQSLRHTLARQITLQYENAVHGSDRLDGLKDQLATALKQNKS